MNSSPTPPVEVEFVKLKVENAGFRIYLAVKDEHVQCNLVPGRIKGVRTATWTCVEY